MELYKEILIHALEKQSVQVFFPEFNIKPEQIIESVCYQTLCQIRNTVRNPDLDDKECFERIEEIICTFENIGSDGGFRHDF
ncbi:MAG: hypothetical protein IJ408_00570 [Clostridia bacterium]|nr:hypothetical protein [Clostridia bacterium]